MFKIEWTSNNIKKTVRIPLMFLFTGWMLMLLMGILHLNGFPDVPLWGYWLCTGVMLIVEMIVWAIRGND